MYIPDKVRTVTQEVLYSRLLLLHTQISNQRLAEKLLIRQTRAPGMASTLLPFREQLEKEEISVWLNRAVIEATFVLIEDLTDRELSLQILRARFKGLVQVPDSFEKAVIAVSRPWIFMALVGDIAMGELLVERYDIELGGIKSWL